MEFFRAGVGAVIQHRDGRVLVCERLDRSGAWQFPQGGLEPGEEPEDAVYREVLEETGIPRRNLELVARIPGVLSYELPPEKRTAKTGRGQSQYWFVFRFLGDPEAIDVSGTAEFQNHKWVPMSTAVAEAIEFRRDLYRQIEAFLK